MRMIEKVQEVVVTLGPCSFSDFFSFLIARTNTLFLMFLYISFFFLRPSNHTLFSSSLLHTFDPLFIINRGLSLSEFR